MHHNDECLENLGGKMKMYAEKYNIEQEKRKNENLYSCNWKFILPLTLIAAEYVAQKNAM